MLKCFIFVRQISSQPRATGGTPKAIVATVQVQVSMRTMPKKLSGIQGIV